MINESLLAAYLGSVIDSSVDVTRLRDKLAGFIEGAYDRYRLELGERPYLGIVVKDTQDFTPTAFLKHLKIIQQKHHMDWILVFDELPAYLASRLRQQKMPFMVPFKQLYWPFIGVVVSGSDAAAPTIRIADKLTPASQAAVIATLSGKTPPTVAVTDLAIALEISKMSASRIANELVAADLCHENRTGRERLLTFPAEMIDLWEKALPFLSSPVRQSFYVPLTDVPSEYRLQAGETGLATRTMLAAPRIPTFALSKEAANRLQPKSVSHLVDNQETCLIEKWKYNPWITATSNVVDRFSLYLSLRDNPDERLQITLEELMEQYFDTRHRPVQNSFRRPF